MSVDAFLDKKYKLEKSENLDEYMKALGVSFILRKAANSASPVVVLVKENDEYTIHFNSTLKNVVIKFKPDIEIDYVTPDNRKVKSVFTINGNSIKEVQKDENGKTSVIETTFGENEIKRVLTVDNITATIIYKRIQ